MLGFPMPILFLSITLEGDPTVLMQFITDKIAIRLDRCVLEGWWTRS